MAAVEGAEDVESLFHGMEAAFERAMCARPDGLWQRSYAFAGRRARVRVVGRELAEHISSAFAHLPMDDTAPTFTIDLWDESETGTPCPAASEDVGQTWAVGGGLLTSVAGGQFVRHRLGQSTIWLDRRRQRLIASVTAAGRLSLYERGKPLHYLLSLWHNDRKAYVIHAGLVARNGDGVLFLGPGGAGKSTSALACFCHGFQYLADDCVALESVEDGGFLGHSVYSAPWLQPAHLVEFPTLAAHAICGRLPGEAKAFVPLGRLHPERLARVATIRALALPRVVRARASRLRAASKGEALLAVAPSSIVLFAPSPGAEGLRVLARLVERVPTYWLELGSDLETIAGCVESVFGGTEKERSS
jgi:hypothetical protein